MLKCCSKVKNPLKNSLRADQCSRAEMRGLPNHFKYKMISKMPGTNNPNPYHHHIHTLLLKEQTRTEFHLWLKNVDT